MNQYDFDQLLKKYIDGKCTEEEITKLDRWSEEQLSTATNSEFYYKVPQESYHKIWKNLNKISRKRPLSKFISIIGKSRLIAVSSLVLISIGVFVFNIFQGNNSKIKVFENSSSITSFINDSNLNKEMILPDGSSIILEPKSKIMYDTNFNHVNRKVELEGQCYFNIKKDRNKPFIVHINNLVTEVLGTSFHIRTLEKSNKTEVEVISGIVNVYKSENKASKENDKNIVQANQKIIYDAKSNQLTKTLVAKPILIKKIDQSNLFKFDETPIRDIMSIYEKYYGLEIHILDKAIFNCTFTGDLTDENVLDQIKLISKSLNAKIEIVGTKIIITGTGCE